METETMVNGEEMAVTINVTQYAPMAGDTLPALALKLQGLSEATKKEGILTDEKPTTIRKALYTAITDGYTPADDEDLLVINGHSRQTWEGVSREQKSKVLAKLTEQWELEYPLYRADKTASKGTFSTFVSVTRDVPRGVELDFSVLTRLASTYPELFADGSTNSKIKTYFLDLETVKAEREAAAIARKNAIDALATEEKVLTAMDAKLEDFALYGMKASKTFSELHATTRDKVQALRSMVG